MWYSGIGTDVFCCLKALSTEDKIQQTKKP